MANPLCPKNLVSGRHIYAPLDNQCIHCGAKLCTRESHESVKADPDAWQALPYVGTQPDPLGDSSEDLELRNCPICGSTLGKRKG